MLDHQKICCVLPAFNAEKTLGRTLRGVRVGVVDSFIIVDDCSSDKTAEVAESLAAEFPIKLLRHAQNRGYGANQKTCYREALATGADVIVMLHPDYQYEPKLVGCLAGLVSSGVYDIALGSRILGNGALAGGMPLYKYIFNRVLTAIENLAIGQKLSEYHTGYRAYSRKVLETLRFDQFSDDFIFDNELLVQAHLTGFRFGEISVPTRYFKEASSISFRRSIVYGFGVLRCSWTGLIGRFRSQHPAKLRS